MKISVFYFALAACLSLGACQTPAAALDGDTSAAGVRREPCGGDPIMPLDQGDAKTDDKTGS
jgi:hypothetical protein